MKVKTSLFITTLLLVGLLVLPLGANVAYGAGPPGPPGQKLGCCSTQDGSQCVACPEGETCITSQDFCASEEGFFGPGACSDNGGEFICANKVSEAGCCVVEPGSCVDDVSAETCFFGVSTSTDLWVSNAACSAVPQCTPTRNIPTMSNWGLIALAGIFILVGVWAITRKKAEA